MEVPWPVSQSQRNSLELEKISLEPEKIIVDSSS